MRSADNGERDIEAWQIGGAALPRPARPNDRYVSGYGAFLPLTVAGL